MLLQKVEDIGSGFQATETHGKHLVPIEHFVEDHSISLVRREA